jgi:hypothetical protein
MSHTMRVEQKLAAVLQSAYFSQVRHQAAVSERALVAEPIIKYRMLWGVHSSCWCQFRALLAAHKSRYL